MLTNLPSDFTDFRYKILKVHPIETYDTNFKISTNIPYDLKNMLSISLINQKNTMIVDSLNLIEVTKNTEGNIDAIVDISTISDYPRGIYYLVPQVRGILSANKYLVKLMNKEDVDNVLDTKISGFTQSEYAITVIT